MLKLIVFDCDGVMFDSKKANEEYYNNLLSRFNHPPMNDDELDFVHMHSSVDSVTHIFRNYPEDNPEEIEQYRLALGYDPFLKFMTIEKDLVQFLETVCHRYTLAISTNRANTMMPLLKLFHLEKYFAKVMTSENARKPKPAPDALLEIFRDTQCTSNETIFIGDSIIDRLHTKSCNVPLIAFKNRSLEAEYHVDCFMDILQLEPFSESVG